MRRTSRNSFNFDFSLRRLLLQGARAARGSPPLGQRLCDVEKGSGSGGGGGSGGSGGPSGSKHHDKHGGSSSGSNKHNSDSTSQHSANSPGNLDRGTSTSKLTPNSHKSSSSLQSKSTAGSGSGAGATATTAGAGKSLEECPLCYDTLPAGQEFYALLNCKHNACRCCLENYLMIEISESRTDISCPQCPESMHPTDIQTLLKAFPAAITKYEDFMVRRVLLADPDSRWCPGPDCSYAVVATGCASCPRIRCERPGCDVQFCYHCKAEWHPDQTCDAARASRQSPTRAPSEDDIKPCPRCQVLIVKMDDGSCNHMVCAICGSEFCWLCMKEISDLHYLSPSGCTFWGKKPWSRKKKLLWQLGTLVGAPLGIALVAGIAVPAMIIGIPVWVGRKIHTRYKTAGKHKRNFAVLGGVTASVVVSPVLAGLAVAIGVPILLFYVYGVVPVSLCRAGCGEGTRFEFDEEEDNGSRNHDATSVDAVSRIGATSIGEVSLSVASGSHLGVSSQHSNFGVVTNPSTRESTTALAGSITGHRLEVQADISTSETASAVTCVSEKSGNTLNDTASTKALAGSILSYRAYQMASDSACFSASEDGGSSERVRFDSNLCYVIDGERSGGATTATTVTTTSTGVSSTGGKEGGPSAATGGKRDTCDIWYTVPLDQDTAADKASLGSGRSFRSSERSFRDDFDSTSLTTTTSSNSHHSHVVSATNPAAAAAVVTASSSAAAAGAATSGTSKHHQRMGAFGTRIPKLGSGPHQHRTLSMDSTTGSYNIPENVSLELEEEQEEQEQQQLQHHSQQQSSPASLPKVVLAPGEGTKKEEKEKVVNMAATATATPVVEPKSRTHILRNLFFAQSGSSGNDQSQGDSSKTAA